MKLILIILTCLYLPFAFSQTLPISETEKTNQFEDEPLKRSEQTVDIIQSPKDQAIELRLRNIISATELVDHLQISSREGIVTILGKVDKKSQSEWLEKLISQTDGVVAVLNKIEISQRDVLDLRPAKNEAGELVRKSVAFIPHLLSSLIILAFFLFIASLMVKLGRKTTSKRIQNPILTELISKLFALPAILLGLYFVLQISGLSTMAASVLGGTGALGLILGFAMKNIIENYFSGLMLSLRKPYKVGDIVEIGGRQGVVLKLATRGTILVDFDGNHIIIPNTTIYGNTIINMTANPSLRIKFFIDIPHRHSIAEIRKIMISAMAEIPQVLKDPESQILVEEFTLSSVKFGVYFWIDSVKTSFTKTKSLVMETIKTRLNEKGISLATQNAQVEIVEKIEMRRKAIPEKIEKGDTENESVDIMNLAEHARKLDHGKELS